MLTDFFIPPPVLANDTDYLPFVAVGLCLVSLVLLGLWFRSIKRKRLIQDIPTSKVKGVAIGLTEVKGVALRSNPFISYLAELPTVWFRYDIEEHWRRTVTETYTDSKGNRRTRTRVESGWKTVQSDEKIGLFFLRDDTGTIRINPRQAKIEGRVIFSEHCGRSDPLYYGKGPPGSIMNSTGRRRFTEHAIVINDPLYIMGSARLRTDAVAAEIAHDDEAPMYLISTRDESQIVSGYGMWAIVQATFGLMFSAGGTGALVHAAGGTMPDQTMSIVSGSLAGLGFMLLMLMFYALILYNGLVRVRERIGKAWALIEVQLQRRADLIPQLASVVKAYADYERAVQAGLSELRSATMTGKVRAPKSGAVDAARHAADGQTALLDRVLAVVEAYPDLKANELYLNLQHELADAEDRIALARAFYNDTVTAYNLRIATLPDVLFARLMALGRVSHYDIKPFERRPVQVDLGHADNEDEPTPSAAQ